MKFCIKTLGCKVNQYESQAIREQLIALGHQESENCSADICVVNTCTVTQKADSESRNLLRCCLKENPQARIIATGCYAQDDKNGISQISPNIIILNNNQKNSISRFLEGKSYEDKPDSQRDTYLAMKISDFANLTKAFVKIQDGCDNFCTYCKVPYARGRCRSRSVDDSIQEIKRLSEKGFKEIVLTGICLGSYGRDLGIKMELSDLLEKIGKIPGDFRVRLSSIEPQDVTQRLIQAIAENNRFCRHLHIPLQSGDDDILRKMGRKYTKAGYLSLVEGIKRSIPGAAITTDVLVGFPQETSENFRNTIDTIDRAKPSRVHIFSYSPRPGTASFGFSPKVNGDIIKKRYCMLQSMAKVISYEFTDSFRGEKLKVLVETKRDLRTNMLQGYTDNYIKVLFEGPDELKNTLTDVTIINADKNVIGKTSK